MRTPDENVAHFYAQIGEGDECGCPDCTLEARRAWAGYLSHGLPWTGEFEAAVMRGEVDVS